MTTLLLKLKSWAAHRFKAALSQWFPMSDLTLLTAALAPNFDTMNSRRFCWNAVWTFFCGFSVTTLTIQSSHTYSNFPVWVNSPNTPENGKNYHWAPLWCFLFYGFYFLRQHLESAVTDQSKTNLSSSGNEEAKFPTNLTLFQLGKQSISGNTPVLNTYSSYLKHIWLQPPKSVDKLKLEFVQNNPEQRNK